MERVISTIKTNPFKFSFLITLLGLVITAGCILLHTRGNTMSFYLTLSVDKNSSDFSIKFNDPISFHGEYEVAVASISYPQTIEHDIGSIIIHSGGNATKEVAFLGYEGEPMITFFERANGRLESEFFSFHNRILSFKVNPELGYEFKG